MAQNSGASTALSVGVVEHGPGVRGLAVSGEVDAAEAGDVETAGIGLLTAGTTTVVVDLTGVRYFGSRGLTALLRIERAARAAGVRTGVVTGEGNRPVVRSLSISGLDRELTVFPTLAAALADGGAAVR